jgi:hypothetical protein
MAEPSAVFTKHFEDTIVRFEKDRHRHKRSALWLKMSATALGATATVLLGWDSPGEFAPLLKNAALMVTALITVVAAYDAFFEPRKLWVRETFVLNSLRDLMREFEIRKAVRDLAPDELALFSDRFHEILRKSLTEWTQDKATNR